MESSYGIFLCIVYRFWTIVIKVQCLRGDLVLYGHEEM